MDSSLIGKIQKARQYAQEPERVTIEQLRVRFAGNHGTYLVCYEGGRWACECHYFGTHGLCSHVMALERLLAPMLKPVELQGGESTSGDKA